MEQSLSLADIRRMIAKTQDAITDHESKISALRKRLEDLSVAERIFVRITTDLEDVPTSTKAEDFTFGPHLPLEADGNPYKSGTNKYFFYEVLDRVHNTWVTANDVQHFASLLKESDIPMSSVSPGLTEMKDENVVVRDGLKVALKKRTQHTVHSQAA